MSGILNNKERTRTCGVYAIIIASKATGLNAGVMRQVANGIKKTHCGFLWRYV